jgi:hypothetical protein
MLNVVINLVENGNVTNSCPFDHIRENSCLFSSCPIILAGKQTKQHQPRLRRRLPGIISLPVYYHL